MTMTAAAAVTGKHAGGCGGDGCDARDPWPLHHVRHRGISCRLCTSCVLKYHPGSFCTLCFDLIDARSQTAVPEPVLVHCSKCTSVAHLDCLPNPHLASQFVCPSCKNPERFSYFPKENLADGKRKIIDEESAKVFVAAANLSLNSLRRAAAVARAEAEKKAKDAAMARKRGREMLEGCLVICKRENERADRRNAAAAATAAATPKPTVTQKPIVETPKPKMAAAAEELRKRKWGKVAPGNGERDQREHKRSQSSTYEKWMRFHEPIPDIIGLGKGERDKPKAGNRVPGLLGPEEKEKKGNLLSSQIGGCVKEDERSLVGSGEKGPRLPQATQDVLVSRTNPRSIFTGAPSTASLHS